MNNDMKRIVIFLVTCVLQVSAEKDGYGNTTGLAGGNDQTNPTARLTVLPDEPYVEIYYGNTSVKLGGDISFSCGISGADELKWEILKDNQSTDMYSERIKVTDQVELFDITVSKVKMFQEGFVTCSATTVDLKNNDRWVSKMGYMKVDGNDDCTPNPCLHGAYCRDRAFDYTCQCRPGYRDKNCSTAPKTTQSAEFFCSQGFHLYSKYCYRYIGGWDTYATANFLCKSMGAKLAEPRDISKNEEVFEFAKVRQTSQGDKDQIWIGATDSLKEGNFTWVSDGQDLAWTNWVKGESNSLHEQDCVEMIVGRGNPKLEGQWMDINCTLERKFICEAEPQLVTTTTTTTILPTRGSYCTDSDKCSPHTCNDIPGDFNCTCNKGFYNTDSKTCEDINECKTVNRKGEPLCGIHKCVNLPGSFVCDCINETYERPEISSYCLTKFSGPTEPEELEERRSQYLPKEITVRVFVQATHWFVYVFIITIVVLDLRTIAMAIHRFITTEPVENGGCKKCWLCGDQIKKKKTSQDSTSSTEESNLETTAIGTSTSGLSSASSESSVSSVSSASSSSSTPSPSSPATRTSSIIQPLSITGSKVQYVIAPRPRK